MADTPNPLPRALTTTERRAHTAYEQSCGENGIPLSDHDRKEFVRQWLECEAEDREAAIEAWHERDPHRFQP
jgi:hypothetical protein